jgi:hypothetical protein
MVVFKYIEDKDVFQKFYSKMLAKRLVQVGLTVFYGKLFSFPSVSDPYSFDRGPDPDPDPAF